MISQFCNIQAFEGTLPTCSTQTSGQHSHMFEKHTSLGVSMEFIPYCFTQPRWTWVAATSPILLNLYLKAFRLNLGRCYIDIITIFRAFFFFFFFKYRSCQPFSRSPNLVGTIVPALCILLHAGCIASCHSSGTHQHSCHRTSAHSHHLVWCHTDGLYMWCGRKSEILILRYSQKSRNFFCFLLFFAFFNCSYLWNQLTNFNGVFCKMLLCKFCIQLVRKLKTEFDRFQTGIAWSHHIYCLPRLFAL